MNPLAKNSNKDINCVTGAWPASDTIQASWMIGTRPRAGMDPAADGPETVMTGGWSSLENVKIFSEKVAPTAGALWLLAFASCPWADAQGTAFIYQGRLESGGNPSEGEYDFRFQLATDPQADRYAGNPFVTNAVPVTNGYFSLTVDFGTGVFNGSNYWLEVDVRTNGEANYTPLSPLQPVLSVPYAVFANTASNLSGTLPAGQLTGTVSSANLSGVYTNAVVFENASGNFSGNGSGLAGVTATQLGSTNGPAVVYGSVSNTPDIVSVSIILTNTWVGGPFWTSNSFAPVAWQYFQPPIGTNISGAGIQNNGNNLVFVRRNKVNTPSSNFGAVSYYSEAGAYTGVTGYETAGASFLFNLNSDRFAFGAGGQGGQFKIFVNGIPSGDYPMDASGNNYTYLVQFASLGSRQIELEINGSANNGLEGIYVPPTGGYAPYVSPVLKRFIIIGDSYSEEPIPNYQDGSGHAGVGLGYGQQLNNLMPALDVWSLGAGGTGYSNTDGGTRLNFPSRIQVDVVSNQPDYVLLAGGINDASYPTNALYPMITNTIGQIVSGSPKTTLFALGPWWPRSPVDPNVINIGVAISNAMAAYGLGSNYIDNLTGTGGPWITGTYNVPNSGNAVQYISSDGTHPTPAGHAYIAQRLADELSRRGVPSALASLQPAVATPADGLTSTVSNGVPLTAITVGPSPFSFTNTTGNNIFVLSGGGTVNSVILNGSPLPPAFFTSGTYPLQPNEVLTVSYTSPPTMLWKPF